MKTKSCFVCGNKQKSLSAEDIVFHRLPDDNRRDLWLKAINRRNVTSSKSFICSNHFKNDDYHQNSKLSRRLKKCAIPFLSGSTPQFDSEDISDFEIVNNEVHNIYSLDKQGNVCIQQSYVIYTEEDIQNIKSDQHNSNHLTRIKEDTRNCLDIGYYGCRAENTATIRDSIGIEVNNDSDTYVCYEFDAAMKILNEDEAMSFC